VDFDVLTLNLNEKDERISLSWQLTLREKEQVKSSVFTPENQATLKRLQELIK